LASGALAYGSGRRFEQMRVLVRIGHDASDRDPVSSDLAGDVTVEVLRRHYRDFVLSGKGGSALAMDKNKCEPSSDGLHQGNPLFQSTSKTLRSHSVTL